MEDSISALAKQLSLVALNNTATDVASKVGKARKHHEQDQTIAALEEIINDLVRDKSELTRIAQAYEQEFVSQKITEKELTYITDNVLPLLDKFIPQNQRETVDQIKSILSIETLTIMQLLGFNYKRAIGEPLTVLLQKTIESKIPSSPTDEQRTNLLALEIIKDPEASKRYEAWAKNALSTSPAESK
jgi:histidine ammonia-lyase